MRKTKKLIALVFAMVFVVAFMAMNVSAATAEPRANCSGCGAPLTSANLNTQTNVYMPTNYRADNCGHNSTPHNHTIHRYYTLKTCRTCGTVADRTLTRSYETCPYA